MLDAIHRAVRALSRCHVTAGVYPVRRRAPALIGDDPPVGRERQRACGDLAVGQAIRCRPARRRSRYASRPAAPAQPRGRSHSVTRAIDVPSRRSTPASLAFCPIRCPTAGPRVVRNGTGAGSTTLTSTPSAERGRCRLEADEAGTYHGQPSAAEQRVTQVRGIVGGAQVVDVRESLELGDAAGADARRQHETPPSQLTAARRSPGGRRRRSNRRSRRCAARWRARASTRSGRSPMAETGHSPSSTRFDRAGRSYGPCGSAPATTMRPSKPAARSPSATLAPPRPAPAISTSVCSMLIAARSRRRRAP